MAENEVGGTPAEAPKKSLSQRAEEGELLTVGELAEVTGNVLTSGNRNGFVPETYFSIDHAAAASLHGWLAHEKATGEQFKTTIVNYREALKSASVVPAGDNQPRPFESAVSRYAHRAPAVEAKQTTPNRKGAR